VLGRFWWGGKAAAEPPHSKVFVASFELRLDFDLTFRSLKKQDLGPRATARIQAP
jgi:hypothetical protein